MKTVLKPQDVAHTWANKLQDNARNSGNTLYFNGDTIYSYGSHFPIAKHVTNERGETAVLFTERHYSMSTSRHVRYVHSACNHLNNIDCYRPDYSHDESFKHWYNEAKIQAEKLLKAHKPEIYLSGLSTIFGKAKKYADFFLIEIPSDLLTLLSVKDKTEYVTFYAKEIEYAAAEEKRKQAELKTKHKKELSQWIKGEINRMMYRNGEDYLRINQPNGYVETSQGVVIPMEGAKKLWHTIKENALVVGTSFMRFTVSQADNKVVKIGCHTFKTDYLIKFGEKAFDFSK